MVPTGLLPPLATGKKVEECVQVIVPVGGKVELQFKVDPDGLGDLGELQVSRLKAHAHDYMLGVLRDSHKELGLSPLEPVTIAPISYSTASRYLLTPITSSPTQHVLSKNIVPSGSPIAYLKGLDINFSWTSTSFGNGRKSPGGEEEDGPSIQSQVDQQEEEDEDFIPLDDCEERGSSAEARFPLIFDGGLLEHASTFAIRRSLVSSMAQFIRIADTHNPSFAAVAKDAIKCISSIQQETLLDSVTQVANVPARKPKGKKGKEDSEAPRRSSYKQFNSHRGSAEDAGSLDSEERVSDYIRGIKRARKEWEHQGNRKEGKRLHRIIGDAMGMIGRATFENRRKKGGRMGYKPIPLVYTQSRCGLLHSSAAQSNETPRISTEDNSDDLNCGETRSHLTPTDACTWQPNQSTQCRSSGMHRVDAITHGDLSGGPRSVSLSTHQMELGSARGGHEEGSMFLPDNEDDG
ncbi:hypothetical protein I316_00143 [Kwoniella heveanensis BCC8398]|uniref:Uncharacterized protein n=1 Tax=Kwoniella heveanensis BCC8398 TaxID=1296120 RepID=A0A1B9H3S4_9TREE|nr:hypothetical protein I316_00143 [Kwoniella heveanensis BCC8398]